MSTLPTRVAKLEEQTENLERAMQHLMAEVETGQGLAPRLPLRSRVHNLESSDAAALAAASALDAIRAERRANRAEQAQRTGLWLTAVNVAVAVGWAAWAAFH